MTTTTAKALRCDQTYSQCTEVCSNLQLGHWGVTNKTVSSIIVTKTTDNALKRIHNYNQHIEAWTKTATRELRCDQVYSQFPEVAPNQQPAHWGMINTTIGSLKCDQSYSQCTEVWPQPVPACRSLTQPLSACWSVTGRTISLMRREPEVHSIYSGVTGSANSKMESTRTKLCLMRCDGTHSLSTEVWPCHTMRTEVRPKP